MSSKSVLSDALQLTLSERLDLVQELWDSIVATDPDAIALSDAQRQELDARLDDLQQNPSGGETWEQVKARIQRGHER